MPEIEFWSAVWISIALLTGPRTEHTGTGGTETGGVKKRAERRGVARVRMKGAEKGGIKRPRLTRSVEGRRACFYSLCGLKNAVQKLCTVWC